MFNKRYYNFSLSTTKIEFRWVTSFDSFIKPKNSTTIMVDIRTVSKVDVHISICHDPKDRAAIILKFNLIKLDCLIKSQKNKFININIVCFGDFLPQIIFKILHKVQEK